MEEDVKPPRSIKIGTALYALHVTKKEWAACLSENAENHEARGLTSTRKQAIWCNPDGTPSLVKETVVHELLHALFDDCGVTFPVGEDRQEETLIRVLSPRLFAAIKENPALFTWLADA